MRPTVRSTSCARAVARRCRPPARRAPLGALQERDGGEQRVCHGAPANSAPVDHASAPAGGGGCRPRPGSAQMPTPGGVGRRGAGAASEGVAREGRTGSAHPREHPGRRRSRPLAALDSDHDAVDRGPELIEPGPARARSRAARGCAVRDQRSAIAAISRLTDVKTRLTGSVEVLSPPASKASSVPTTTRGDCAGVGVQDREDERRPR